MARQIDLTLGQIHPRALDIVRTHGGVVQPGRREDKSPNFRGLSDAFWQKLFREDTPAFIELVQICRQDFPTYCALLLRVVSRFDLDLHPFIWSSGQRIVWNAAVKCMRDGRMIFIIILKARQLGITTFVAAWHHWQLWRGENVRTLNVAHDKPLAERIIGFFRVFHDSLPDVGGIKPPLRSAAKGARVPRSELYYADRGCLGATYIADNMEPRGHTTTFVGEHEAAFYTDLDGFNDALLPQLPAIGSKARARCSIFVESTPNGQNPFFDMWEESKKPESEITGVFLPWFVYPEEYSATPPKDWRMTDELIELQKSLSFDRIKIDGEPVTREQMYWYSMMIEQYGGDVERFDHEYPSNDIDCFAMRSENVFSGHMRRLARECKEAEMTAAEEWKRRGIETNGPFIGELQFDPLPSPMVQTWYKDVKKPALKQNAHGYLQVWEPPQPGHTYMIGIDTAGGGGDYDDEAYWRDSSVAEVICITCGRQAAEVASPKLGPEALGDVCVHLATWNNQCMVFPEINGLGSVVLKRMANNWGYMRIAHEEKWDELGIKKNKPGFNMTNRTRPMLFSNLKWMIEEQFVTVSSFQLLREMSTFKREGMEFCTTKKGQHDDRLVAFALALFAIRQAPRLLFEVEQARKRRVPTAVDLGLNTMPMPSPDLAKASQEDADAFLAKYQKDALELPFNVLRGYAALDI